MFEFDCGQFCAHPVTSSIELEKHAKRPPPLYTATEKSDRKGQGEKEDREPGLKIELYSLTSHTCTDLRKAMHRLNLFMFLAAFLSPSTIFIGFAQDVLTLDATKQIMRPPRGRGAITEALRKTRHTRCRCG